MRLGKLMSGILGAIFLVYVTAAFYSRFGGIEGSLQSLSPFGHKLLMPWTLIAGVCIIRFLWRDSLATTGSFELVELRKRNRARWAAKVSAWVFVGTALAWLAGFGALHRIATRFEGPTTSVEATVTSQAFFRRTSNCRDLGVRLRDGAEESVCTQRGIFVPDPPPEVRCARVGDLVALEARDTVLGRVLRFEKGPAC